jgi:hypothetical protein
VKRTGNEEEHESVRGGPHSLLLERSKAAMCDVYILTANGTSGSWPTSRYSIRKAWVGLMEAARRAGIQAATSATRTSTAGTSVNVTASCGLMP